MSQEEVRQLIRQCVADLVDWFQAKISCPAKRVSVQFGKQCKVEVERSSGGKVKRSDRKEAERVRRRVIELAKLIDQTITGSIMGIVIQREGDPIVITTNEGVLTL